MGVTTTRAHDAHEGAQVALEAMSHDPQTRAARIEEAPAKARVAPEFFKAATSGARPPRARRPFTALRRLA